MQEKDGLKYYEKGDVFSKSDYYQQLKNIGYEKTYGSFLVAYQQLINNGMIIRTGRNLYKKADSSLRPYTYSYSELGKEVIEIMNSKHHYLDYVVFETDQLNEFLSDRIEKNTVFVFVDNMVADFVYDTLHEECSCMVMASPKAAEFKKYRSNNTVVVTRLISEAPKDETVSYLESIEKMLVDIMSETIVKDMLSDKDLKEIYETAFSSCIIDESRMLRYGRRRNAEKKIRDFINNNTSIVLSEYSRNKE